MFWIVVLCIIATAYATEGGEDGNTVLSPRNRLERCMEDLLFSGLTNAVNTMSKECLGSQDAIQQMAETNLAVSELQSELEKRHDVATQYALQKCRQALGNVRSIRQTICEAAAEGKCEGENSCNLLSKCNLPEDTPCGPLFSQDRYCFQYNKVVSGLPDSTDEGIEQTGVVCLFQDGTCDFLDFGFYDFFHPHPAHFENGIPGGLVDSPLHCTWRLQAEISPIPMIFSIEGRFTGPLTGSQSFQALATINPNGHLGFQELTPTPYGPGRPPFFGEGWIINETENDDWFFGLSCASIRQICRAQVSNGNRNSPEVRDFCRNFPANFDERECKAILEEGLSGRGSLFPTFGGRVRIGRPGRIGVQHVEA